MKSHIRARLQALEEKQKVSDTEQNVWKFFDVFHFDFTQLRKNSSLEEKEALNEIEEACADRCRTIQDLSNPALSLLKRISSLAIATKNAKVEQTRNRE